MCTGKEDDIMNCEHSGWAEKSMYALCNHDSDAGVQCLAENKGKVLSLSLISAYFFSKNLPGTYPCLSYPFLGIGT